MHLLSNAQKIIIENIKAKEITFEALFNVYDNLSISISALKLNSPEVSKYFYNVISYINSFAGINNDNNNLFSNQFINNNVQNNLDLSSNNELISSRINVLPFKDVAINWFNEKFTQTSKNVKNKRKLSRKTLQGYNKIMNNKIIPYFKDNENIDDITDQMLQSVIDSTNGDRNKEAVYVVLNMILEYARKNRHLSYLRTLIKPIKNNKKEKIKIEGHEFVYIESSRQNLWLDTFEKEGTNVAYLFESMLLEGFRPEEACGLDWESIKGDFEYIYVHNAFKDFPIYNESAEIIGHYRENDDLKTAESYRTLPIHPRLKKLLIEHKAKQQAEFKRLHLKWSRKTAIFLNRYHQPYIAENLSKCMRAFRDKYNLEYLTPYGLRHSFATFLSEQGMRDIVLMKLMGHAEFSTTQKYYIFVSDERKKIEYQKAWGYDTNNKPISNDNSLLLKYQKEMMQNELLTSYLNEMKKMWLSKFDTSIA